MKFFKSLESDAVILGACGGPKWDNLEFSKKPERALLKLRKELKLFANLRPAICFKQLVDFFNAKTRNSFRVRYYDCKRINWRYLFW